jgi:hypothetical protein
MPVAQKIKAAGRKLIGIGTRRNTNKHWAKSCHEFRYYDSLVEAELAEQSAAPEAKEVLPVAVVNPAAELLRRAVRLLAESKGDAWVNKANVWPMIKRLDPTFDLKEHGHASFGEMLRALDQAIEVRKGDGDHQMRLR